MSPEAAPPGPVLVTGANGFVGSALMRALCQRRITVVAATRGPVELPEGVRHRIVDSLGPTTRWAEALEGCSVVVHCSARVHVMRDTERDPLAAYREANVLGSVALARQAASAGVRRLVFLSSIKVHGEGTPPGRPFHHGSPAAPVDPYGISKAEAEAGLREVARETGLELVIVRPPLVYGPGVRANFLRLTRWVARGVPLPLGRLTENRRSLVALDNLVDLLVRCVEHPAAAGQAFLVSDGEDLSTTDLLRRTATALGVPARLVPVPAGVLRWGARLSGRYDLWQRLAGSLQVDIGHTTTLLDWHPPVSVDEGLARTVAGRREGGP